MDSTIECAVEQRTAWLRVTGRATYALAPPLARFIDECRQGAPQALRIDLKQCVSMDSTFVGILTQNILRTHEARFAIELVNTPEHIAEQIRGLGLARFFTFTTGPAPAADWHTLNHVGRGHPHPEERVKETMREAHEALGAANPENVARFENVLDALQGEKSAPAQER